MIPGVLILALVVWACCEAHRQWGNRGTVAIAGGFVLALFLLGSIT